MYEILGWHFVGNTLRDGSPIPDDGEWLQYNGPLVLCRSGLHASITPWHALRYAPGGTLCRVAVRGDIIHGSDKLCGRERRIIARMDATEMLRHFARMQAVSVLGYWTEDPPDVVLDWLMTGDERLRSAAGSAAAATWSVAGFAAGSAAAAWFAAGSAAGSAESAAWSAAESAAWSAAGFAAGSAESAAEADFNALVYECFEGVE